MRIYVGIATAFIAAACGGSSPTSYGNTPPPPPPPPPPPGPVVDVSMTDNGGLAPYAFAPATLSVKVGTTVKWSNTGNAQHTTTSDAATPVWSSGSVSPPGTTTCPSPPDPNYPCTPSATPGGNFQQTFTTAGTYQYHCDFHKAQGMTGTITVTP